MVDGTSRRILLGGIGVCYSACVGVPAVAPVEVGAPTVAPPEVGAPPAAPVEDDAGTVPRSRGFTLQIEQQYLDVVPSVLIQTSKVEMREERGGPLVILVGTALLVHIADAAIDIAREIKYGGIVVDARGAELLIEREKALDSGTIVVVTSENVHFFEEEKLDPADLIASFK